MRGTLAGLAVAVALTGPVAAADVYGVTQQPVVGYQGHKANPLPACDDPAVVARIPERFAYQDARITLTGLTISGVDNIMQTGLKAGGPGLIDRRYCGATAWLSNGQTSDVYYIIEGPKVGFASIGWHTESCLPGFDPYRVYDARCRTVRP